MPLNLVFFFISGFAVGFVIGTLIALSFRA